MAKLNTQQSNPRINCPLEFGPFIAFLPQFFTAFQRSFRGFSRHALVFRTHYSSPPSNAGRALARIPEENLKQPKPRARNRIGGAAPARHLKASRRRHAAAARPRPTPKATATAPRQQLDSDSSRLDDGDAAALLIAVNDSNLDLRLGWVERRTTRRPASPSAGRVDEGAWPRRRFAPRLAGAAPRRWPVLLRGRHRFGRGGVALPAPGYYATSAVANPAGVKSTGCAAPPAPRTGRAGLDLRAISTSRVFALASLLFPIGSSGCHRHGHC
ncbi:hypothetical protein PVAP13_2KG400305 [Panicum virgatum]|uniref:Uncharacterized protein n=1 Tax=Panicum virgatum TaxID=38727 RepID=A0A8T0WHD1_PANVG|nr:hypothetical protein PVAP13_2KG400305 [Panicum virgatum]